MKFQSSRDRDEKLERLEWESIKHRQSSKRVLIFHPVSVLLVGRCEKVSFSSSEAIHERTMKKDRVLRFKGCFSWNFLSFYEAWNFCVIKKSRKEAPTKKQQWNTAESRLFAQSKPCYAHRPSQWIWFALATFRWLNYFIFEATECRSIVVVDDAIQRKILSPCSTSSYSVAIHHYTKAYTRSLVLSSISQGELI